MIALVTDFRTKSRHMYERAAVKDVLRALASDGSSAMVLFRLSQLLRRLRLSPGAWLVMKLNKMLNGITIGAGADVAPGFVIQHSVGIVINGGAKIGPGCILEGGVVIGSAHRQSPTLGEGVYVGSGAKIIGGINLGPGARVGANAVVVKDVPAGATVVGIPARVI